MPAQVHELHQMFYSGTAYRQQRRLKRKEVYGKPLHFLFNFTVNLKLLFFFFKKKAETKVSESNSVHTHTHIHVYVCVCVYLIVNHMKSAVVE